MSDVRFYVTGPLNERALSKLDRKSSQLFCGKTNYSPLALTRLIFFLLHLTERFQGGDCLLLLLLYRGFTSV